MASNVLNDLDSQLATLQQLKAPGASKGKIQSITTLCVNNIQAESNIVQSLYRALKKSPATHKLGSIYVIDSVVRKWIESAKANGQDLNVEGRGESGTFATAVKRVTELMPALFEDVVKGIPAEQKDKLEGMVKIWEKGNTFPAKMISDFKAKLGGTTNQTAVQTKSAASALSAVKISGGEKFAAPLPTRPLNTPTGSPPQYLYDQGLIPRKMEQTHTNGATTANSRQPPEPAQTQAQPSQQQNAPVQGSDVNSILAALANSAAKATPQQAAAQPAVVQQSAQLPANIAALLGQQNGTPAIQAPPQPPQMPQFSTPQAMPPFHIPQSFPGYPPQPPPSVPQHYPQAPPPQFAPPPQQQQQQPTGGDPLAALRHILPQSIVNDRDKLVQALQVLKELQNGGVPMGQWGPVLEAFDQQYNAPAQQGHNTYNANMGRERSRSPDRARRRASPVYDTYDAATARKQVDDDNAGRGGNANGQRRYRQRTPVRDSPAPTPQGTNLAMNGMPMQPKYIAIDNSLPRDSIKVLSRTLFVGGANGTQQEIQTLFERFGRVQTCIANRDKRHAFVKMTKRQHALDAKAGMERLQAANDRETMNIARQTKWGVGFGPRECCDYAKGESIIPIHKLTDADMKWLLTAEYGGTGGQKIEGDMVLEEPDIEIGAGVSSKAMSKRVLPDTGPPAGGNKRQRGEEGGGQSQRGKERFKRQNDGGAYGGGGGGYGGVTGGAQQPPPLPMHMEQYGYVRPEPVAVATPPAVPDFGFSFPGAGQSGYRLG